MALRFHALAIFIGFTSIKLFAARAVNDGRDRIVVVRLLIKSENESFKFVWIYRTLPQVIFRKAGTAIASGTQEKIMSISPISSNNVFNPQQQPLNGTSQTQSGTPTAVKHHGGGGHHHGGGASALQNAENSSVTTAASSGASGSLIGNFLNITA
jgi:hypothetical protein